MIIIGLMGPIGSGKTTFADDLNAVVSHSLHLESSDLIIEVANDLRVAQSGSSPKPADVPAINQWLTILPEILQRRTGVAIKLSDIALTPSLVAQQPQLFVKLFEYLTVLDLQPSLREGTITHATKPLYRPLLQWLGGYLKARVDPYIWYRELIRRAKATPDIALATIGGVRYPADAVCITEAGGYVIALDRPSVAGQDLLDITERERSHVNPACVVHNNGSLVELRACAQQLWNDLTADKLQQDYFAAESKA